MAGRGVDGSHPVSSDEDELSESSLDEDGTVHQRHNDKQKVETLLVYEGGEGDYFLMGKRLEASSKQYIDETKKL